LSFSCAEILGITSASVDEGGVDADATISDVSIERALVQCGDAQCEACCAPALVCDPDMMACGDASLLHCDNAAGCAEGVCCYFRLDTTNTHGYASACQPACEDGSVMCDPLADSCTPPQTCQPGPGEITKYFTCQ
jgi:hypothetical protein